MRDERLALEKYTDGKVEVRRGAVPWCSAGPGVVEGVRGDAVEFLSREEGLKGKHSRETP